VDRHLGGLVRFDGVRFTVFDPGNTPGLKDARILALSQGRDGALWIGTAAGGVARLEHGVIRPFEPPSPSSDRSLKYVRSLHEAADGSLWVGTSGGGIRRFRAAAASPRGARLARSHRHRHPSGPPRQPLVRHDGGLAMLQGSKLVRYDAGAALPHPFVYSIFEDRAGTIWVGTRGGLTRIKDGTVTNFTRKNGFPADAARIIREDRHGNSGSARSARGCCG